MVFEDFRNRMTQRGSYDGQAKSSQSIIAMDATFKRDPAFREVFVTHAPSNMFDEQYDAKFLVNKYYSITGDNVDYYLQLRPTIHIPLGSYVDIINEVGEYEKWLVVAEDDRPMFFQYYILKCNWTLKWITDGKMYECLGVRRTQNSYNSGVWASYVTTTVENQTKFWMPTTPYTQTISYNNRVLMNDEGRKIPIAWEVTKVEDLSPKGITKLTFAQRVADMIEDCPKYGLANYCKYNTDRKDMCSTCEEPVYIDAGLDIMPEISDDIKGYIDVKGKSIRVNGMPKTFTSKFYNETSQTYLPYRALWNIAMIDDGNPICGVFVDFDFNQNDGNNKYLEWNIKLDDDTSSGITMDVEYTDSESTVGALDGAYIKCYKGDEPVMDIYIEPESSDFNAVKIKCMQEYNMAGMIMRVSATNDVKDYYTEVDMEVVS